MIKLRHLLPPGYAESPTARLPVLYMSDDGIAEDFLHVAGLGQVLVGNETMRPLILVGIENTERQTKMGASSAAPALYTYMQQHAELNLAEVWKEVGSACP